MVIFMLVKILFYAVSSFINIISLIIFSGAARLLVLVIHGLKIPGEGVHNLLEIVANFVKSLFEYLFEFLMEMISNLVSTVLDLVKDAVFGSISSAGGSIMELIEKTKTALEGLSSEDFSSVVEGFSDMIWSVVTGLWENYKGALGYVKENNN
ncbi:hypothetical protein BVC80_7953g5 [Macleaya cordata]|uniref:Uncharacterized protein n=1 Tax=Macleaya cordata TaxID=56857 RepID=A0A200Q5A4_MACCD|nr:hypothetical protein BVC80_7953g5 [Macleaya cordata]